MNESINTLKFNWLLNEEAPDVEYVDLKNSIDWKEYPFPTEMGSGGYEKTQLEMGISFFHSTHHFNSQTDSFIPLAEVNVEFSEKILQIQSVKGGSILYLENGSMLENKPGIDLFRYTQKSKLTPILDTSLDSELFSLTIPETTLISLLGDAPYEHLMTNLRFDEFPSICTQPIPLHISKQLHHCLDSPSLNGELKSLHSQIRVLEYLSSIVEYLLKDSQHIKTESLLKESETQKVYQYLSNLNGKLPKINIISEKFGFSSRALNNSFKAYYKESIYTVINNARLDKAHEAIIESNIPLKVISTNLGYSHVNHFSHAFRQKYGYPPGSLRRKNH